MERICPGAKLFEGFTTARSLLLACVLVATFESPIGNSMDSFVLRYEVRFCPEFLKPHLQIIEQVVNGRTEATIGAPRSTYYPLPEKGDTAPAAPNSEPMP